MNKPAAHSRVDEIWNDHKKKLQLQFKNLTDKDLSFETGRKQEMIDRIAKKLNKSDAEMDNIFRSL